MKHIATLFVLALVLNSCNSELKPTSFETISIEETYDAEILATYSSATGKSELSKTINTNVENTIVSTLDSGEDKTNLSNVLKGFNSEYLKFKSDFPDITEPVWELNIETELTYQSEEVITIAISTYEFKGGAHGNDNIKFVNLNAKTGAILAQNDIIENNDEFKVLAEKHFLKSQETEGNGLTLDDFFFGKPFQLPENIGFSDDGLVLLYNVYEVASYDQGYTEFVIPLEELESYLKVF